MRTSLPRRAARAACAALLLAPIAGCAFLEATGFAPNRPDPEAVKEPVPPKPEAERVVVRHVLIGFAGSRMETRSTTRTKEEAERLAAKVFNLAQGGRDFAELARLYSDDRHGTGTYTLTNYGVGTGEGEFARSDMARGFADLAFSLAPGGTGLVSYDANSSPMGWHVIRRER